MKKIDADITSDNEMFKTLAENSPNFIMRYDKECKRIYANPAFSKITGIPMEDVIGHKPQEQWDKYFKMLNMSALEYQNRVKAVIQSGENDRLLTESIRITTGEYMAHDVNIVAQRDAGGRIIGALVIGHDITEYKKMEESISNLNATLEKRVVERTKQLEEAIATLKKEEKELKLLDRAVNHTTEAIYIMDENFSIIYVNDGACNMLGFTRDELTSMSVYDIDAKFSSSEMINVRVAIRKESQRHFETRHKKKDGDILDVEITASSFVSKGKFIELAVVKDITERKRAETKIQELNATLECRVLERTAELQQALALSEGIITALPDTLFELDIKGAYLNVWAQDEFLLAQQKELLLTQTVYDVLSQEAADVVIEALCEADEKGASFGKTIRINLPESENWFELSVSKMSYINASDTHFLVLSRDVTERINIEKNIEYVAHHDILTGLPNRVLVKDRAKQILARSKRFKTQSALLFIDLDGFKTVNDSLGHTIGDIMLQKVASRLQKAIRESDTISRQGGDEFLLILPDIKDENEVINVAHKVLQTFSQTFNIDEHVISTSASIGIALYPDHGESFEELLQNADAAMYKAKESGKNDYFFYSQKMKHQLMGLFKMQNDLKVAIKKREFILHYQPQIDLAHNKIVGVEALIRWKHLGLTMVQPNHFIPIAEESGIIIEIGEWVLMEACTQAALWHKQGKKIIIAVNISSVQFQRGNLEETIDKVLRVSGLNPRYLELELTESILINDTENILQTVRAIKALGVQFSIDDFGTGYSSLSYLKRFAVDKLKIDQSFIRDIIQDHDDATIVKTIIQMAKSFNLRSIAEGVENEEVLALVKGFGCDEVQGYHYAKPMPAKEFEDYYESFLHS